MVVKIDNLNGAISVFPKSNRVGDTPLKTDTGSHIKKSITDNNEKEQLPEKLPFELEKAKTKKQKATDVAYTLNHALVCAATDFIDPFIGDVIQKKLGNESSSLMNTGIAEFIGDFGAVPATVAVQRIFPGFMNKLSKIAEPVVGHVFHKAAEKEAKAWATEHKLDIESPEYKKRVDKIYQYEISHLPQAFMWTTSSIGINVLTQRLLGNTAPISNIMAGKVGGAVLTAAITASARCLFPRQAKKWDKFTTEKILLPVTNTGENIFGMGEKK
jgi:hypothetical protein